MSHVYLTATVADAEKELKWTAGFGRALSRSCLVGIFLITSALASNSRCLVVLRVSEALDGLEGPDRVQAAGLRWRSRLRDLIKLGLELGEEV